jgi:predicted aspartyl protease
MCKEIIKINDVTTKTPRPFIKIETIKGIKQDWLFDTGACLTCMSSSVFRKINIECRPQKIDAIGSKAQGASGGALLPQGVYIIPMEWNGKKIMQKVQIYQNLAQPTILGIDAIHNLGITYLTETQEFMFQNDILQSKFSKADLKTVSFKNSRQNHMSSSTGHSNRGKTHP